MQCPKCGGDMWDNREKKASGEFKATSPDFKCKDKNCKDAKGYVTASWVDDGDNALPTRAELEAGMPNVEPPANEPPPAPPRNPSDNFMPMAMKHSIDDAILLREYADKQGLEIPPSEVAKWVTTLFIQRMRG